MGKKDDDITLRDVVNHMSLGFGRIDQRLSTVEKDVRELKTDVKVLKTDVKVLKTDVKVLKTDVKEIKKDIKEGFEANELAHNRLDELESNVIPAIKSHIGMAA